MLREMGFTEEAITEALAKNGSLDAATAYLLGEDATQSHLEPTKVVGKSDPSQKQKRRVCERAP
jgi:hypothetical protein